MSKGEFNSVSAAVGGYEKLIDILQRHIRTARCNILRMRTIK
ncbi:MAG: hypothetical protein ACLS48_09430 [[Eubacterium] siraeum]